MMKQQDKPHIMKNPEDPENNRLLASNRKARHDYDVIDVVEAGIVLLGSEVKSIRSGEVQIADAYAHANNGEMWLDGMHIGAYAFANGSDAHDPTRRRKLLMHKEQIRRLQDRIAQERLTLVPLELRLSKGRVKVELALAKGRQKADRRQAIAKKESELEMRREAGRNRRQTQQ
jgi:SsrA-binding protein